MREIRKALLLVVATSAVMAAGAPSAFGLELRSEQSGLGCGAIEINAHAVSGGTCLVHVRSDGNIEFRQRIFGIPSHMANCGMELLIHFEGLYGSGYANPALFCGSSRVACFEAATKPWEVSLHGTVAAPRLKITTCIEPSGGGTESLCTVEIPFYDEFDEWPPWEPTHMHNLNPSGAELTGTTGGPSYMAQCSLRGAWKTEVGGPSEVEIEPING